MNRRNWPDAHVVEGAMRWLVALLLVLAVGCTGRRPASFAPTASPVAQQSSPAAGAPAASPTALSAGGDAPAQSSPTPPSPTPPPRTPTFAVLLDVSSHSTTYDLSLVALDGSVPARAVASKRSVIHDAIDLPYISTSNVRVYYLDGDRDVRYLRPDGSSGFAASLPGSNRVHAVFAVTPDDRRIAVALLDYAVSPVRLTVYVEDLGGANHRVIFTSTDRYVWPVAWHAGQLVVAYLGPGAAPFISKSITYGPADRVQYPYGPNPYGGINFHVIDPVTATRKAIISGGGASGLLVKSGTAVVQGDAVDWNGRTVLWQSPDNYGAYSAAGSLSPDGSIIAASGLGLTLVLWYRGGGSKVLEGVSSSTADWVGWFDESHVMTGYYRTYDGTPAVVDIDSGRVTTVNAHGIVVAMLPAGLD